MNNEQFLALMAAILMAGDNQLPTPRAIEIAEQILSEARKTWRER